MADMQWGREVPRNYALEAVLAREVESHLGWIAFEDRQPEDGQLVEFELHAMHPGIGPDRMLFGRFHYSYGKPERGGFSVGSFRGLRASRWRPIPDASGAE